MGRRTSAKVDIVDLTPVSFTSRGYGSVLHDWKGAVLFERKPNEMFGATLRRYSSREAGRVEIR